MCKFSGLAAVTGGPDEMEKSTASALKVVASEAGTGGSDWMLSAHYGTGATPTPSEARVLVPVRTTDGTTATSEDEWTTGQEVSRWKKELKQ